MIGCRHGCRILGSVSSEVNIVDLPSLVMTEPKQRVVLVAGASRGRGRAIAQPLVGMGAIA